jgi:ferrous iron transport protein B
LQVAEGAAARAVARIALAGNPNTGKTSLFNRLTGANARVGNYPGVTVERAVGAMALPVGLVEVLDIPGAYALAARSAPLAKKLTLMCVALWKCS